MDGRFIRVRWGGNNSKKYDGQIQDVLLKSILSGHVSVGGCIRAWIGKSKKTWKGVIVHLLEESEQEPFGSPVSPPPSKCGAIIMAL